MKSESKSPIRDFFWWWSGGGLLLAVLSWSWLSRGFVYGEGHERRPILLFLASCAAAWLIFALAANRLRQRREAPVGLILGVAIAARLILLPSNLILENDPYRYALDGQMTLRGENPYLLTPLERAASVAPGWGGPLASEEARRTLGRISYPEIPTVYPPVAQLAFAAGAWMSGWDWRGQRWFFMALDLIVLTLLIPLLRGLGADPGAVLLYAWNPLVLKEIANSAHLDVLVVLFLVGTLSALKKGEAARRPAWTALAGASFGLAVMSKLYPALLFPAFALHLGRRKGWAAAGVFAGAAGGVALLATLPFLGDGLAPMLEGLRIYAREWRMNQGLFSLFEMAFPSPRGAVVLTVALFAILLPWFAKESELTSLVRQTQWILLVWFLLIPSPFPWYALPLTALAALSVDSPPGRATIALSGAVLLYYLSFHIEYQELSPAWWTATRTLEHGMIVAALLFAGRRSLRFDTPQGFPGR